MKGFLEFIRKQSVVGLAVGFILGGAVSKLVSALVEDIVNPFLSLVLGATGGLKDATLNVAGAVVKWGDFLSIFVDFVVIAAVVYFLLTVLKLDRLNPKEEKK